MNPTVFVLSAALLTLSATGCADRSRSCETSPTVQIATVESYAGLQTLEFPGRVEAAGDARLAFKVAGRLQHIYAREGAFVRRGQTLAALDDRDYKLQSEAVEAEYRRLRAEAERVMALYADSVATPDAYDKARYGLRQIEAKYENARNQLADTRLTAPFDGYVQKHLVDPGTVVGAGMPVLTFISNGAPEIEINIPGSEYVRRNDFAGFEATFDFWPDRRIPLQMIGIAPKANANQLYAMRLAVPADARPLPTPGMNTMVTVSFSAGAGARSAIPASALFRRDDTSRVWVLAPDSTVHSRAVRIERLHTDGRAVLSEGLESGERIVSAGVHVLHEGQHVRPLSAPSHTNIGGIL